MSSASGHNFLFLIWFKVTHCNILLPTYRLHADIADISLKITGFSNPSDFSKAEDIKSIEKMVDKEFKGIMRIFKQFWGT